VLPQAPDSQLLSDFRFPSRLGTPPPCASAELTGEFLQVSWDSSPEASRVSPKKGGVCVLPLLLPRLLPNIETTSSGFASIFKISGNGFCHLDRRQGQIVGVTPIPE
jgi:hypothetical protein